MSSSMLFLPIAVMTFLVALLLVAAYLIPRLTRPDLYFAVTVPPDFRDSAEGQTILSRYHVQVVLYSLLALAVVVSVIWKPQPEYLGIVSLVSIGLQMAGVFLAYYAARRRVLPHAAAPTTVREAELAPREIRLPGGALAQLGPFAILALTAAWLGLHWEQIPPRFPIHWGIDGQPNRWAARTFGGVFAPILIGALMCSLMALLAYALLRWSRPIRVRGTLGANEQRFRHLIASILVAAQYFLAIEFTWTGLLPLSHTLAGPPGVIPFLLFSFVFAAGVLFLLIRFGQGGTRLRDGLAAVAAPKSSPVGDRTEDRFWKLGLFYFNPDDPVVFVEKRFGIGYTINFGHPGAWLFIGALVAVVVLIGLLVPKHP